MELIGSFLLLALSAFFLRSFGWRGAPVFAALAVVTVFSGTFFRASDMFSPLFLLGEKTGIEGAAGAAVKILGLGYLYGISCDVIRELGENSIAKAVETVGRLEIIAVSLPFLEEIIRLGVELIE